MLGDLGKRDGDRVEEFHKGQHRPSNWVVKSVKHFTSPDTEQKIVVCYCDYIPVEAEWQEVKRGQPVAEMLQAVGVVHIQGERGESNTNTEAAL